VPSGAYTAPQTLPVTISGTNGMNPYIRATLFGS
jgi:hypothetical protein